MPDNPFIPSFGVSPLYLAGRDDALASLRRVSLTMARTDYSRASLIIGSRGIGKTVTLNAIEDDARDNGYFTVKATATRGFLGRMVTEQMIPLLAELDPAAAVQVSAELTLGIEPVKGSIKVESVQSPRAASLRSTIYAICKAAPERGLLFTIDEINSRARDELEEFASVYQHAIRDGLNVSLVMCGIPASLSALLNEDRGAMTFLNRSNKVEIGLLDFPTAQHAFAETIQVRGTRTADRAVIHAMAAISRGYPFLIQEIGNKAWDVAPDQDAITIDHVASIMEDALRAMNDSVLRPIFTSLTDKLQEALIVIAREGEGGRIRTSHMARALDMPTTAMGGLQQRLIESGVIVRDGHGMVRIAIPYMQEFLADLDTDKGTDRTKLAALDSYPDPRLSIEPGE